MLVPERLLGDETVDLREFLAEEVQLAKTPLDGQALVDRELLGAWVSNCASSVRRD